MKWMFKTLFVFSMLLFATSCSEDEEQLPAWLEVNYATLNGTWKLVNYQGAPLQDEQYVYITFQRKEHTFEMYDNMASMYAHRNTGTFVVEYDKKKECYFLNGEYDFSQEPLDEYIVSEMTSTSVKFTKKQDSTDVAIYERCPNGVPEEIVKGTRTLFVAY